MQGGTGMARLIQVTVEMSLLGDMEGGKARLREGVMRKEEGLGMRSVWWGELVRASEMDKRGEIAVAAVQDLMMTSLAGTSLPAGRKFLRE